MARQIDAELARPDCKCLGERVVVLQSEFACPPVHVTERWLVQVGAVGLRVVRIDEVVWVRRVIFFPQLPPHQRPAVEAVEVFQRDGASVLFATSPEGVDALLQELFARLPWVLAGKDGGWQERWRHDRAALVAEVEARRQCIQPADVRVREVAGRQRLEQARKAA